MYLCVFVSVSNLVIDTLHAPVQCTLIVMWEEMSREGSNHTLMLQKLFTSRSEYKKIPWEIIHRTETGHLNMEVCRDEKFFGSFI